jgi:hypothetical protein
MIFGALVSLVEALGHLNHCLPSGHPKENQQNLSSTSMHIPVEMKTIDKPSLGPKRAV